MRRVRTTAGTILFVIALGLFSACGGALQARRGGGDSPEAAVQDLLEAVDHGDVPAVFKAMAPEETEQIARVYDHALDTARDKGYLTTDSPLSGIDIGFEEPRFETTQITEDVAQVALVDGKLTYEIDAERLPTAL